MFHLILMLLPKNAVKSGGVGKKIHRYKGGMAIKARFYVEKKGEGGGGGGGSNVAYKWKDININMLHINGKNWIVYI